MAHYIHEVMNMQNNIKDIAHKKNIKISQVIKDTGLSKSYVYDVINQKSNPTLVVANRIATALKAGIHEVFPELSE
jgi:putative transcriptional regulator